MFRKRFAWLHRHLGDRADTSFVTAHPAAVRAYVGVLLSVICALVFAVIVYPSAPFVAVYSVVVVAVLGVAIGRPGSGAAAAQRAALGVLSRLPRGNTVFSNVLIPSASGSGSVPISLLVATQKGYIVIDPRHHRGRVVGDYSAMNWSVEKESASGRAHTAYVENPASQVRRQVHALASALDAAGVRGRVSGLVVYTHPDVELCLSGDASVRVLRLCDLRAALPQRDPTGVLRRVEFAQALPLVPVAWNWRRSSRLPATSAPPPASSRGSWPRG